MKHWYNNGQISKQAEECPEGYVPGRIKKPSTTEIINQNIFNQITQTIPANDFIDFYIKHTRAETLSHFGIRTEHQLVKILSYFNYDFSIIKESPFKGKQSPRTAESYKKGGKKSAETQKLHWEEKTEDELRNWSDKMSKSHLTEHYKEIKTIRNREIWEARTEEERQEINRKRSETMKAVIENLSEEEKAAWVTRSYKKYKYKDNYFDSFPELCYFLYHDTVGNNIKRSKLQIPYYFNGERHLYLPDFELEEQLIEIKGDHLYEQLLIENTLENAKYECMLENNVTILTSKDYKQYEEWFSQQGFQKEDFFKI